MALTDEIVLIQMQRPGIDGAGITDAEKAQLVNDVATALARANITGIAAIPGVVISSLAEGDSLVYLDGSWRNGSAQGTIDGVYTYEDSAWVQVSTDATGIYFGRGVVARQGSGGAHAAVVEVVFGGTGAATTVARTDHTHTIRPDVAFPFDASGTLSSGSRPLASGTVSSLNPDLSYIITAALIGDLRGGGTGAGYTLPRITIGASARDRFDGTRGEVRTVSGVDRQYSMEHPGLAVTGVTSVAVSATLAYRSGDPIIVGAGELTISIRSDR